MKSQVTAYEYHNLQSTNTHAVQELSVWLADILAGMLNMACVCAAHSSGTPLALQDVQQVKALSIFAIMH